MKQLAIAILLLSAAVLAGCTSNTPPSTTSSTPTTSAQVSTPATTSSTTPALHADLLESGSTFVLPLAQKWAAAFSQANAGVTVSANGGGSGKGQSDISKKLVDIAGSDGFMNDSQIAAAGGDLLHFPVAGGAVTMAYNVPEVGKTPLKFDGPTIANIFLGKITKWNDPALQALNPGVNLPAQSMAVVHRSDGSGTTATFTDYLAKVSPDWASMVGHGTSVSWPCEKVTPKCTGASGNNGVGGQIQSIPYSVGYLGNEWANITAVQTGIVKNAAGNFETPTSDTVAASIATAVAAGAFDAQLRGSVTNQNCANCYPIALVTWFIVHQHQDDKAKGQAVAAFLHYALHDGQGLNAQVNYNTIPASVVAKEDQSIATLDYNGQPLMTS